MSLFLPLISFLFLLSSRVGWLHWLHSFIFQQTPTGPESLIKAKVAYICAPPLLPSLALLVPFFHPPSHPLCPTRVWHALFRLTTNPHVSQGDCHCARLQIPHRPLNPFEQLHRPSLKPKLLHSKPTMTKTSKKLSRSTRSVIGSMRCYQCLYLTCWHAPIISPSQTRQKFTRTLG